MPIQQISTDLRDDILAGLSVPVEDVHGEYGFSPIAEFIENEGGALRRLQRNATEPLPDRETLNRLRLPFDKAEVGVSSGIRCAPEAGEGNLGSSPMEAGSAVSCPTLPTGLTQSRSCRYPRFMRDDSARESGAGRSLRRAPSVVEETIDDWRKLRPSERLWLILPCCVALSTHVWIHSLSVFEIFFLRDPQLKYSLKTHGAVTALHTLPELLSSAVAGWVYTSSRAPDLLVLSALLEWVGQLLFAAALQAKRSRCMLAAQAIAGLGAGGTVVLQRAVLSTFAPEHPTMMMGCAVGIAAFGRTAAKASAVPLVERFSGDVARAVISIALAGVGSVLAALWFRSLMLRRRARDTEPESRFSDLPPRSNITVVDEKETRDSELHADRAVLLSREHSAFSFGGSPSTWNSPKQEGLEEVFHGDDRELDRLLKQKTPSSLSDRLSDSGASVKGATPNFLHGSCSPSVEMNSPSPPCDRADETAYLSLTEIQRDISGPAAPPEAAGPWKSLLRAIKGKELTTQYWIVNILHILFVAVLHCFMNFSGDIIVTLFHTDALTAGILASCVTGLVILVLPPLAIVVDICGGALALCLAAGIAVVVALSISVYYADTPPHGWIADHEKAHHCRLLAASIVVTLLGLAEAAGPVVLLGTMSKPQSVPNPNDLGLAFALAEVCSAPVVALFSFLFGSIAVATKSYRVPLLLLDVMGSLACVLLCVAIRKVRMHNRHSRVTAEDALQQLLADYNLSEQLPSGPGTMRPVPSAGRGDTPSSSPRIKTWSGGFQVFTTY